MFCKECGTKFVKESKHCEKCGALRQKPKQTTDGNNFSKVVDGLKSKATKVSNSKEYNAIKGNITNQLNQTKAKMGDDFKQGGAKSLVQKNIPIFAGGGVVVVILLFMLMGGGGSFNKTPEDLIKAVIASTSLSDYKNNCATTERSAELKWRKVNRELEQAGIAGEDIEILQCASQDGEDFTGLFICNDEKFAFKQERCVYNDDTGWRTEDDINLRSQ